MTVTSSEQRGRQPPTVQRVPVFGNALGMMSDPLLFLRKSYIKYGPVYLMKAFGREIYVISGLAANRLLATASDEVLSKSAFYGGLAEEFGETNYLTASDGDDYRWLRSQIRPGYSRQRAAKLIPQIVEMTREYLHRWEDQPQILVVNEVEKLIADLIGFVVLNSPASTMQRSYRRIIETLMMVHAMRIWPRLMLRLPQYRAALRQGYTFAAERIEWHRQHPPAATNRHYDLIDDLLAIRDAGGHPLSEKTIQVQVMTPMMVGIDTATSGVSFLLRCLLENPESLEQVRPEADTLFAEGMPNIDGLRNAPKLHAAFIEMLRLYPISPFIARRTLAPIPFEGYTIPADAEVLVATGVTHYLPEYFDEPEHFRLDRPSASQYAYMPFGGGTHVCVGSGVADVVVSVVIATLLHDYVVERVAASKPVEIHPVPNPGRDFSVRIYRRCV